MSKKARNLAMPGDGCGSKLHYQVLVHVSIYLGSQNGYIFLTHSQISRGLEFWKAG